MKLENKITKDFILNHVTQEEIFSHYCNIPILVIEECINFNRLTSSPFRYDSHASVGFRYGTTGKLKMKDFGGSFWGDCFDAVAKVLNTTYKLKLNVVHKEDFLIILHHIAVEFNLTNGISEDRLNINQSLYKIKSQQTIIEIELREYGSKADYNYWIRRYHNILSYEYLYSENIYPVERYWINPEESPDAKYYFTNKDPCYAYYDGRLNNIPLFRLYFPARSKDYNTNMPKFISNSQSLQCLNTFKPDASYDKIVITKSRKDAIIIKRLLKEIDSDILFFKGLSNIAVIAYPQENYKLSYDAFQWLIGKLKSKDVSDILVFLDFDKTGIKTALYTYYEYGIPYVFLTNGIFGLPNYGSKDISDYLEKNGVQETVKLIKSYIDYVTNTDYNTSI
jgi:hypothetical protein